jgi:hypothetical protein
VSVLLHPNARLCSCGSTWSTRVANHPWLAWLLRRPDPLESRSDEDQRHAVALKTLLDLVNNAPARPLPPQPWVARRPRFEARPMPATQDGVLRLAAAGLHLSSIEDYMSRTAA